MIKDFGGNPDSAECAGQNGLAPQTAKTKAPAREHEYARFRTALWLGLAADARSRTSQT